VLLRLVLLILYAVADLLLRLEAAPVRAASVVELAVATAVIVGATNVATVLPRRMFSMGKLCT
jgi:hypothetical protein